MEAVSPEVEKETKDEVYEPIVPEYSSKVVL